MKNFKKLFLILPTLCFFIPAILSAQKGWTCVTPSAQWSGRFAPSLLVFHDKMWIIGGDSCLITVNNVWYSTDGDSWICATASAPWSGRSGMGSFVFDDKMWITGGFYWTGSYWTGLDDVWWSSDGINWTEATDSAGWAARGIHTAVVFHDTMWVIGGLNNTWYGPFYNDVWKSADGVSWVCATDSAPWLARGGHTSVIFHDSVWVIGGVTGGHVGMGAYSNDIWYSTDGINWICALDSVPWGARYGRASVVFQDMIWLMAGFNIVIGRFFNDVWYSADGSNWLRALDSAPWSTRHFPASVVYNNKIWLMGGTPDYYSGFNDVWYSTGLGRPTPGYWKNHPDAFDQWLPITIAGVTVSTVSEAITILDRSGQSWSPWYKFLCHLLATTFNALNDPDLLNAYYNDIVQTGEFMEGQTVAYILNLANTYRSDTPRGTLLAMKDVLDNINNSCEGENYLWTTPNGGSGRAFSLSKSNFLTLSPNPFSNGTEICFLTNVKVPITLSIYNINGVKVRDLVNNGNSPLYWDGTDNKGRKLNSGVYVIRYENKDQSTSLKVLINR